MKNIIKIVKIAKPLRKVMLTIAFLILVSSSLALVNPLISKSIVDQVELSIKNEGGELSILLFLVGLAFVVDSISNIINSVSQRLGDHFAGELRKYLTEKFYDKVLKLPQSYFDSEISGKIVNQLNRGIFTIQNFTNTATNFILPSFIQSIFTITVLSYFSLPIGLLTLSLFPIYFILTKRSAEKWGKEEVKKNKVEDIGRGRIQEVISNIKVVKGFTNESNEYEFIEEKQDRINEIYAVQSKSFHIYDFLRNMSLNVVLLGINLIVFYSAFTGTLSLGEMVLIIQLVMQARRPLFAISFILTQVQLAESGSKEYFEVLDLKEKEDFRRNQQTKRFDEPSIEFKNVKFSYEDNKENVLDNVSFKLNPKDKIALVGRSGAGKTTTINLIMKLYEPQSGDILINGHNYNELSHRQVRDNISLVFQDNELFSSTIRENVSYGMEASEKDINSALKLANAYEFVQKLKKGIDSEIGERGIKLSGGQKQRIQIARAILKNAPILILDEATSSLDSKSELQVQEALENLMKDKLTIIIAHRFSTIQNVDRIIVLKDGKIEDQGDPAEMARREGTYSELLKYQVEGNKKLLANYELF